MARKRRFEVLSAGEWVAKAIGQINEGETFRGFEASGEPVRKLGSTVFRALKTVRGHDGKPYIESEAVVIATREAGDTTTAIRTA